jgi:hypothetical protein
MGKLSRAPQKNRKKHTDQEKTAHSLRSHHYSANPHTHRFGLSATVLPAPLKPDKFP